MTLTLDLVLLIAALVCFVLAALDLLGFDRVRLIAIGLALWVLTALV
jgi:hypothetical protein